MMIRPQPTGANGRHTIVPGMESVRQQNPPQALSEGLMFTALARPIQRLSESFFLKNLLDNPSKPRLAIHNYRIRRTSTFELASHNSSPDTAAIVTTMAAGHSANV